MFQRFIKISDDSYIEISTRIINGAEKVTLSLRGTKDDNSPAIATVPMEPSHANNVMEALQDAEEYLETAE